MDMHDVNMHSVGMLRVGCTAWTCLASGEKLIFNAYLHKNAIFFLLYVAE
jgi:hypothetical protein